MSQANPRPETIHQCMLQQSKTTLYSHNAKRVHTSRAISTSGGVRRDAATLTIFMPSLLVVKYDAEALPKQASLLLAVSDDAVLLLMVRGGMPLLAVVCGDVISLLLLRDEVSLLRDEVPSLLLVYDDVTSGESGEDVTSGESGMRSVDGHLVCIFVCTGKVCVCRLECMSDRASPAPANHKSVPLMIAHKQVHACP